MEKSFPIDFIRQIIEQTLFEEHVKNPNKYFGGKSEVNLFSFYEQLQKDDEVDRYVEIYRDLTEQQNRTGLIMNGTIVAPENPTITNINSATIIPMSFTCSFRVRLGDRDMAIDTINHLIKKLKGRKQDVAMFENGTLLKVGTMGNNVLGSPQINHLDYLGTITTFDPIVNIYTEVDYTKTIPIGSFTEVGGVYGYNETINVATDFGGIEILSSSVSPSEYSINTTLLSGNRIRIGVSTSSLPINAANIEVKYKYISSVEQEIDYIIDDLETLGFANEVENGECLYFSLDNYMVVAQYDSATGVWSQIFNDGENTNIPYPPENETFEKYKVSLSFDSIRCDEPRNLNAEEWCVISFGGSATIVNENVLLGNEMTKLFIKKKNIISDTVIDINDTNHWLEPLELPSANNVDTQVNHLLSNNFVANTHSDSIALSLQYSFILDKSDTLLTQLYKYGRYAKQGTFANNYLDGITPNMIFEIKEYYSSWGNVDIETFNAKIVESIEIENTESDVLSIVIPFQLQGDNN